MKAHLRISSSFGRPCLVEPPYVSGDKGDFFYVGHGRRRDKLGRLYLPANCKVRTVRTVRTILGGATYVYVPYLVRGWGQRNRPDYDDHCVATKLFRQWDVSDSKSTQNSGQVRCFQNFSDIPEGRFANNCYIASTTISPPKSKKCTKSSLRIGRVNL